MKLTSIAIAFVAFLAMAAVEASIVSAKSFTSTSSPVGLSGTDSGNHKLTVDGQEVKCTTANFETGEIATPANEINGLTSAYSGCTAFGFAGATVNMGNCDLKIKTPTKLATNQFTANARTTCNSESKANINASIFGSECSVSIGESGNEELSHIIIHNTANNPTDLTLTTTINSTRVTKNKDNGLCPLSGTGTVNNGTREGPITVKAKQAGVGISISN